MKKILTAFLIMTLVIGTMLMPAVAETTTPTTISPPQYFGAYPYIGEHFTFTISAPDDMRAYIEAGTMPGYTDTQIDYKMGNGDWHYTSDWDTAGRSLKNTFRFSFIKDKTYIAHGRDSLIVLFPDDTASLQSLKDKGWDWNYFKTNPISFRARFVSSFDNGVTFVYSDWSNTFVLSDKVDYNPIELMKHAPTLTTAAVEKNSGGMPFLNIKIGRLPGEVQSLNSMTGESVWTEIWMRKLGDKEFKKINSSFFSNEYLLIGVMDYFDKTLANYDSESYEVKIRFSLDMRKLPFENNSNTIYSPYSNIISHNMPAWSEASAWATDELKKAEDKGLIPDILKGEDLTKPINREEFAELAVLLYEKTTSKASIPLTPNPFTDTNNPQILKAAKLEITFGTSSTTFTPAKLINREECSAMLFRTMNAITPDGDYNIDGIKDFPDQKDISEWAIVATKYMSKLGIIEGDSQGKFMPKATTTAQQASAYGMATREQAIIMSGRTFDAIK